MFQNRNRNQFKKLYMQVLKMFSTQKSKVYNIKSKTIQYKLVS